MLLQKDSADVLSGGIGAVAYTEAMERDNTATDTAEAGGGENHVVITDHYFSACSSSGSPEADKIRHWGRHCDRLLFIYRGWLGDIRSRYMG